MSVDTVTQVTGSISGTQYLQENGLGKEAFLKLLVAQLTNQDPLEPMENHEFLGQLSQYSSLEQLMNLNETLSTNNDLTMSVHNALMTNMIGKDVRVQGDTFEWSEGTTTKILYYVPQEQPISIEICDASGEVVRKMDVGLQNAGDHTLEWDGRDDNGGSVSPGYYSFRVYSKDGQGGEASILTYIFGRVTGIQFMNGNPILHVGNMAINPTDVVAVYEPSED